MKTIPALLTAGILLLAYDGIRAGTPDGTCGATGISPQVSAFGDPLVATDALGRELPNYAQTGGEKPNRYVGLFYWLWHGPLRNDTPDYDISKTLRKEPDRTQWPHLAYYWGEPELGYYRSSDAYVMQKHLSLFCLVGIDFLFLDFTNLVMDKDELRLLLRLTGNMRRNGYDPRIPSRNWRSFTRNFTATPLTGTHGSYSTGNRWCCRPYSIPPIGKSTTPLHGVGCGPARTPTGFGTISTTIRRRPPCAPTGWPNRSPWPPAREPRYGTTRPTVRKVPRGTARPHTTATGTAHAPAKACFSKSSGKGPNVSVR